MSSESIAGETRKKAGDRAMHFRCYIAPALIAFEPNERYWACHACVPRGNRGMGRPCVAAACSFIALAAWVRQLPLWLLKSRVVTECLQSGHLKVLKPVIIVIV